MFDIKDFLFKTLFSEEYWELYTLRRNVIYTEQLLKHQRDEQEKIETLRKENLMSNGKGLSDRLYRAIGKTVDFAIDGNGSHEYRYSLERYHISIPSSLLTLYLLRNGDRYTISKRIDKISINDSLLSETNYRSKVHLTLDGEMMRIYINWDRNVNVPEENEYFESTAEKPYDKFTGLKHTIEHYKYWKEDSDILKEKYFEDKFGIKCGLIHVRFKDESGTINVFTEDFKDKTGIIEYTVENYNGEKVIEIIETFINENTRRRGHGKQAMMLLIEYAKEIGAKYLYGGLSSVDEKNEGDKIWRDCYYKSMGFTNNGKRVKRILH